MTKKFFIIKLLIASFYCTLISKNIGKTLKVKYDTEKALAEKKPPPVEHAPQAFTDEYYFINFVENFIFVIFYFILILDYLDIFFNYSRIN